MNRRPVFTDEEILDRARSVFLERGYAARTRQISAAVGMTWGAIALRFGDKASLFQRAMAGPERGAGPPTCEVEGRPQRGADLGSLMDWVRTLLWERWPLRLQYRLGTMTAGGDHELEGLVQGLASELESHARHGTLRSDLGVEVLARLAVALLTGDVAHRFVARERTLAADPALIDGVVRLLSARPFQRPAGS
jgi:AcrR family transcriptional regulator